MQRGLLLDVVVSQRAAILQLLASEDAALLVGRDACGKRTSEHGSSSKRRRERGRSAAGKRRGRGLRRAEAIAALQKP